jgi:cytochrome b pre-mRNA-processing protein 3
MFFRRFSAGRRRRLVVHTLYASIIEQARQPDFCTRLGVPDTLDGRFELIVLYAYVVMRRLKAEQGAAAPEAHALSQALFDLMFLDMDHNLRELGVSDMSVGKRVKQMAKAFYGRVAAYDEALAGGDDAALAGALRRNLYGTVEPEPPAVALAVMAAHLHRLDAALAALPIGSLLQGEVAFAALEGLDG